MSQENNEKWFIIETWTKKQKQNQDIHTRTLKVTNKLPIINNKEVEKQVIYKINDEKSFVVYDWIFSTRENALRIVQNELWYDLDNLKVGDDEYQDMIETIIL